MGSRQVWQAGEEMATRHLISLGWQILDRNWRCPAGELDIVAWQPDPPVVVFCEVKCRRGLGYGTPLEAITAGESRQAARGGAPLATCPGASGAPHPVRRVGCTAAPRRAGADHPRAGDRTMSLARSWSVALIGMEGAMIEVEAAIGSGLPKTILVGLPDAALYEARDRCKAAMASAGFGWPSDPVTINLSPGHAPQGRVALRPEHRRSGCRCARRLSGRGARRSGAVRRVGPGRASPRRAGAAAGSPGRGGSRLRQGRRTGRPTPRSLPGRRPDAWGVTDLADLIDVLRGGPGASPPPPTAGPAAARREVRPGRCGRPGRGQVGARGGRRRTSPCLPSRLSGRGQDAAGRTAARATAGSRTR